MNEGRNVLAGRSKQEGVYDTDVPQPAAPLEYHRKRAQQMHEQMLSIAAILARTSTKLYGSEPKSDGSAGGAKAPQVVGNGHVDSMNILLDQMQGTLNVIENYSASLDSAV